MKDLSLFLEGYTEYYSALVNAVLVVPRASSFHGNTVVRRQYYSKYYMLSK